MPGERVIGVINGATMQSAFGGTKVFSLFFTATRVIAAKMIGRGTNALLGNLSIGGVPLGSVLISQKLNESKEKADTLKSADPEEILKQDKDNFSISYPEIKQVWIGKPLIGAAYLIITANKKYRFFLQASGTLTRGVDKETYDSYVTMLKKIIPDKLKV